MIYFLKKRLIYTPDAPSVARIRVADRLFTNDWQTAYAVVYQVFRLFFFKSSCLKLSLCILPYIRVLHKGLAQDSPKDVFIFIGNPSIPIGYYEGTKVKTKRVSYKNRIIVTPTTKNFKRNNCVVLNRFRFIVAVPSCEL